MKLSFMVETVIPKYKGTKISQGLQRVSYCVQAEGHEGKSVLHQSSQQSLNLWGPSSFLKLAN